VSDAPVWLLDVDGVLNADYPAWDEEPARDVATANGWEYPMTWSPSLVERIKGLHDSGLVEVRWSTTWVSHADELERVFGLDLKLAFPADEYSISRAKQGAALRVVDHERRALIWTDDDVVPLVGTLRDYLDDHEVPTLLIKPSFSEGLTPTHIDQITAFARSNS
jgi:hypothetical protein